jgi:DNA-binding transcriptional regulator YiaG
MGKVEGIIKSEIVRLAKREVRKISVPLGRDVWSLKSAVSQLRKAVLTLQRITAHQQKELEKGEMPLEAAPEEVKVSRFSPRLIRSLRGHLGITQKELAILTGVTVGAVMVALRKLGRREVRKLVEKKSAGRVKQTVRPSPSKRRGKKKKSRK